VVFFCDTPRGGSVSLVGNFNEWQLEAHPMKRMPDGRWMVLVELPHGHHRYLFLADEKPKLDPRAQGVVHEPNMWHDTASLIAVS